jgi:hypothetical protein
MMPPSSLHSASTSTSQATSPPHASPHASDGECASPHAASARTQQQSPASVPGLVPREWLRVTDAPALSCVGSRRSRCSVEGGVQVKVEEGVSSQPAHAERVPHSFLLAVLAWVCVYGVTGCTADSSRVDTGGSVHSGAAPLSGTRAPMESKSPARGCRQSVCVSMGGSDSEYWD